jgi:hypothetical protein
MLRDDERTRASVRGQDLRGRYRPPQRVYRVPVALDIAPPRRRKGPGLALAAGLLAVGAGGYVASRTVFAPDIQPQLASADAGTGADAPLLGARIMVPSEIRSSVPGFVSTLRGMVDGAVSLTANGLPIEIEPGGQFRIYIAQGLTAITLAATDQLGRVTEAPVAVTENPKGAEYPPTVAVHVRALDWINPAIHDRVIELARSGRINAVELDVKDEAGEIGYDSDVELASISGADASAYYDPQAALDELHGLGVRVIGRVVCFLDPIVAGWAWQQGRSDLLVLNGNGSGPLVNNYGSASFTNLANDEIRRYQMDLAVEAAQLGFDEILYDYVRRPEGDLAELTFPGLDIPPEVSVARFVADTKTLLEATGTELGVSVFGISATRPLPIAQDIGLLAPNVDYVSPMVYPSHWGAGEYGVANPNAQPADIVRASLADFDRLIAGSGAAMVPWLQDFSAGGITYGPNEVRAQIDASAEVGGDGFLLWNSGSVYHGDALDPVFANAGDSASATTAGG